MTTSRQLTAVPIDVCVHGVACFRLRVCARVCVARFIDISQLVHLSLFVISLRHGGSLRLGRPQTADRREHGGGGERERRRETATNERERVGALWQVGRRGWTRRRAAVRAPIGAEQPAQLRLRLGGQRACLWRLLAVTVVDTASRRFTPHPTPISSTHRYALHMPTGSMRVTVWPQRSVRNGDAVRQ